MNIFIIRRVKTITDSHINQNIFRFSLRLLQTILKCHYANSKSREKHKNIHKFNVLYLNNQHFLTLSHPQDLIYLQSSHSLKHFLPYKIFKTYKISEALCRAQCYRALEVKVVISRECGVRSLKELLNLYSLQRRNCRVSVGLWPVVTARWAGEEECANTCYLLLCTPLILRGERGLARNQDYS